MLNKKIISLACAASMLAAPISSFAVDTSLIFGDGPDLIKKEKMENITYGQVFGSDLIFEDDGSGRLIKTVSYDDIFGRTQYAVTVDALTNGTITPSKTEAAAGEIITLTVTPADNYSIGEVKVNGTVVNPVNDVYSFTMPAENVTVSATFIENAPETYAVTVGALTNGTVTPSKTEAAAGEIITLTVTPADNYSIGEVKVNGTVVNPVNDVYSFTMPA
ncbi:MAG: hypothetical protein J6N52_11590, partial [Clostridia bacterium]|nr:hypothetical protein [Clostridia bacterium]